jgi:hypothetical protein
MSDANKDLRQEIGAEISKLLQAHGFPIELIAVLNSYGDTLDDAEVLDLLRDFNRAGVVLERVIATRDMAPTKKH